MRRDLNSRTSLLLYLSLGLLSNLSIHSIPVALAWQSSHHRPQQDTLPRQSTALHRKSKEVMKKTAWRRRDWMASLAFFASITSYLPSATEAFALSPTSVSQPSPSTTMTLSSVSTDATTREVASGTTTDAAPKVRNVLFQDLSLRLNGFDTNVPVACWWPAGDTSFNLQPASYAHRISVRRIGQLLAQWNFIPSFASRNFVLRPSQLDRVWQGSLDQPFQGPVVILAHGYLGSRFDLSHLAETLAAQGFICLAPEYPESLAASYEGLPGLDRGYINQQLLQQQLSKWQITGTKFGIVGHSLGTGTALTTGDDSWARVCLAGFPRNRDGSAIPGNLLLICSLNDGAMNLQRFGGLAMIPQDYTLLRGNNVDVSATLPRRAAWILDGPSAPNHISFLSAGVNDAMIDLLSPLLPVAQWANIPVLDFDKYQASRDALPTAQKLHPVIVQYLKQEMNVV